MTIEERESYVKAIVEMESIGVDERIISILDALANEFVSGGEFANVFCEAFSLAICDADRIIEKRMSVLKSQKEKIGDVARSFYGY